MKKVRFIFTVMRKGFSWKDTLVASMFVICCAHDYGWLARRSKRILAELVKELKARCGEDVYKLARRGDMRPDVQDAIRQAWVSCGFIYGAPFEFSKRIYNPENMPLVMGGSGSGKTRYVASPVRFSQDQPK